MTFLPIHLTNGTSELMSHHTGVSTRDVVAQGIMDKGILVLYIYKHTYSTYYTNQYHYNIALL